MGLSNCQNLNLQLRLLTLKRNFYESTIQTNFNPISNRRNIMIENINQETGEITSEIKSTSIIDDLTEEPHSLEHTVFVLPSKRAGSF